MLLFPDSSFSSNRGVTLGFPETNEGSAGMQNDGEAAHSEAALTSPDFTLSKYGPGLLWH